MVSVMSPIHTVLVVDDEADVLSLVGESLTAVGLEVVKAQEGAQAKALFENLEIDLAVLDINMPGVNGIDLCKIIKGSERGSLVPVLFVTARDSLEDKVSGLAFGADDYLTKPFQVKELQARVKALLRVRDLSVSLRSQTEELLKLQAELIEKERALLAVEMGATAAHRLGQPLSALAIHIHLLGTLEKTDVRFQDSLKASHDEITKMKQLIEEIRSINPKKVESYHGKQKILS